MLIAVGAGFGLVQGLRVANSAPAGNGQMDLVKARIDALDLALARLGEQTDQLHAELDLTVTPEELSQSLERVVGRLEAEVDARLDLQAHSVEALRLMVGQTDELLQKVLDGLESIRCDRDLARAAGH